MAAMPYASDAHKSPHSLALNAFLHGIEPRAWVFALSQCGDPERANAAMASALHDFVLRAATMPLAKWPIQFWTSLLKQPGSPRRRSVWISALRWSSKANSALPRI